MSYLPINPDLIATSLPSPGAPSSFATGAHAAFVATRDADWTFGRQLSETQQYSQIAKDIEAKTGKPLTGWSKFVGAVKPDSEEEQQAFWAQVEQRRAENPEALKDLTFRSHADVQAVVARQAQASERQVKEIQIRGGTGAFGATVGEMGAFATDPVLLATVGLGAPARLNMLRKILTETAIGAGTVAAVQPIVQANREALSLEHGGKQALQNVLGAAVGTLALGTLVRGAAFGGRVALDAFHGIRERVSPNTRIAANDLDTLNGALDANPLAHPTPADIEMHGAAIDRATLEATHGDVITPNQVKPLEVSTEALRSINAMRGDTLVPPVAGTTRLYRGIGKNLGEYAPGQLSFFTTDLAKAEKYGVVHYVDITAEEAKFFVQGHGGTDEFLTDSAAIIGRVKPVPRKPIMDILKEHGIEDILPEQFGRFLGHVYDTQDGWMAATRGQDAILRMERATDVERTVLAKVAGIEDKLTRLYNDRITAGLNLEVLGRAATGDIRAAEEILADVRGAQEKIDRWHKIQDERFSARRRKDNKAVESLNAEQADIEKKLKAAADRRAAEIRSQPRDDTDLLKQREAANDELQNVVKLRRKAVRQFEERVTQPVREHVERLKKAYEEGAVPMRTAARDTQRQEAAIAAHEENVTYQAKPDDLHDAEFAQAKQAATEDPTMAIEPDNELPGQTMSAQEVMEDLKEQDELVREFEKCIVSGFTEEVPVAAA